MTYNSKSEIEADIAKLQKLLADFRGEPDYEALRPALVALYEGSGQYTCETPMDTVDKGYARGLLAAYPHLKAYHEAREPEWIGWGPDSEGYPNCPVPDGKKCEVRFRAGDVVPCAGVNILRWDRIGLDGDIIAYRIIGDTK